MIETKNGRGHLKNDHGKLPDSLRRVDKMAEANLNLASATFQNDTIRNFNVSIIKYNFVIGKIFSVFIFHSDHLLAYTNRWLPMNEKREGLYFST